MPPGLFKPAAYGPFWASIAIVIVAMYVFRANRHRPINQFFTALAAVLVVWQLLILDSLVTDDRTFSARCGLSLAACLPGALALFLDLLEIPDAKLGERISRILGPLLACLVVATIPWSTGCVSQGSPGRILAGPLYPVYLAGAMVVVAHTVWGGFEAYRAATVTLKFELRSLGILAASAVASLYFLRTSEPFSALATGRTSLLVVSFFCAAALLFNSGTLFTAGQLLRILSRHVLRIGVWLSIMLPVAYFLEGLPIGLITLSLVLIAYPVLYAIDLYLGPFYVKLLRPGEQVFRERASTLANGSWAAEHIDEGFRALGKDVYAAGSVETIFLDGDFSEQKLDHSHRILLGVAKERGWITREYVLRSLSGKEARELTEAFELSDTCLVISRPVHKGAAAMFVGRLNGARVATWPDIQFGSEILSHYGNAMVRSRVATESVRAHQLAQIGFLASQVRHETRNRLESVRAVLELLNDNLESNVDQEHRHLVLVELCDFIEDFNLCLDMARPDYNCLRLEAVPIGALFRDLVQSTAAVLKRHAVTLETFVGCDFVMADRRFLKQALFNLLRNGIQAAQGSVEHVVRLSATQEGGSVHIEVHDSGPGVPPELHGRLFQDYASTQANGVGLGLSISRSVISLLGGSIEYLNAAGIPNAKFRVTLFAPDEGVDSDVQPAPIPFRSSAAA
jgi:signal transduction histidine kinase